MKWLFSFLSVQVEYMWKVQAQVIQKHVTPTNISQINVAKQQGQKNKE